MARRLQCCAARRRVGLLVLFLALAVWTVFAVPTGAVEVFIDATRGAIQKVPIAVYSFKSGVAVTGQPPADVLKEDLRRSLLFEVADLERLGIRAEVNSQPKPEVLQKAREAALLAVETYNRPGTAFRSGGFIVLMMIAWTALFHATFFKKKMKPYYHKKGSRRFERVEGDYKTWELAECVRQFFKDQNPAVRKNLEFFIGLRNKIEHRILPELDSEIFGECQATLMNFEAMLSEIFGGKYAVGPAFPFALQFSKITQPQQQSAMRAAAQKDLKSVRSFVEKFRSSLTDDVSGDQAYSYRVFLIPKVGTQAKSSDVAIEFVKYDPSKPEEMQQYERVVALIKPKQVSVANLGGLKASQVVKQVAAKLGKKFTLNTHVKCWKHFNTRPSGTSATPMTRFTRIMCICLHGLVFS